MDEPEEKPLSLDELMFPRICSICGIEPLTAVGRIIKACRSCRANRPKIQTKGAASLYKFGK